MKVVILVSLICLASCSDGNSADQEEGGHSTYSLANSDDTITGAVSDTSSVGDSSSFPKSTDATSQAPK